ncbi:MAG: OmpH family outer membrane protein [Porphyromonas sp.]|nr:OmpH family outer membrane protein [Porphyromonas sp.]
MNRKNFIAAAIVALAGLLSLGACGDAAKTNTAPAATTAEAKASELPIAYVRMDSVMSQYKYSQDIQAKLEADTKASQSRLQSKAAAFQKAAEDFQRRAQINAFTSDAQAKSEQERVMRLQQEAAQLDQKLSGELAQKTALMQEDLIKKIQEELKLFNGGRYKLILSNATVLYADEALDITEPFIKHLNENYKELAPKAEEAKK